MGSVVEACERVVVACGILFPWPGIEPGPSAFDVQNCSTGPSGKSLCNVKGVSFYITFVIFHCQYKEMQAMS